jgi:hypothetical protein
MGIAERGDAESIDPKKMEPGTIVFHEALDRCSVQCQTWTFVQDHMAILNNPDLFWKAAVIERLMQDFYTELEELHFND